VKYSKDSIYFLFDKTLSSKKIQIHSGKKLIFEKTIVWDSSESGPVCFGFSKKKTPNMTIYIDSFKIELPYYENELFVSVECNLESKINNFNVSISNNPILSY
jgi:hypothetical protein